MVGKIKVNTLAVELVNLKPELRIINITISSKIFLML